MPEEDRTQVVVTGLGAVCALAGDIPSLWSALLEGRAAAGPVPGYAAPRSLPAQAAAHLGRAALFALDASLQALADAFDLGGHHACVILGRARR